MRYTQGFCFTNGLGPMTYDGAFFVSNIYNCVVKELSGYCTKLFLRFCMKNCLKKKTIVLKCKKCQNL